MSDTAWFWVGVCGGAVLSAGAAYLGLLWYFTRSNPF